MAGELLSPSPAENTLPVETPSYKRLTDADRLVILKLHDDGLSQSLIAQRLARSLSTINGVIQTYAPTMDMAKRKLQAASSKLADHVIAKGKPSDHVEVLGRLGVIPRQDDRSAGLHIQIGISAEDVHLALSPSETSEARRRSTESLTISTGSDNVGYVNDEAGYK